MFVTMGRVREALGRTRVRLGERSIQEQSKQGESYSRVPRFGENTGRIGERLSGQGICQICARMQHWGRKWFSLDRSSGCGIPLKKEQECGITGCYQLVLRNFTIKKNVSNAGKYFS